MEVKGNEQDFLVLVQNNADFHTQPTAVHDPARSLTVNH